MYTVHVLHNGQAYIILLCSRMNKQKKNRSNDKTMHKLHRRGREGIKDSAKLGQIGQNTNSKVAANRCSMGLNHGLKENQEYRESHEITPEEIVLTLDPKKNEKARTEIKSINDSSANRK